LLSLCAGDRAPWSRRSPARDESSQYHTVWFALLVGGVVGGTGGYLARETGTEAALAIGGFVTIASHIAADALTPMGVTPFAPLRRRTYTVAVAPTSNPIANYALLVLGATLAGGALYLATTVSW
jgi:inner membrane protein